MAFNTLATKPRVRTPVVRESAQWKLLPLLGLSIALHLGLAFLLALVLTRHTASNPEDALDLGIDVTLGEAVQELVVAAAEPEPPPAIASPPEPVRPAPELPPPIPIPKEVPDFIEPKAEAKPEPKQKPKPAKREQPKAPLGAKVGPVPQAGVVNGNVTQGATAGTVGGEKVGQQSWSILKPPYPPAALAARIQGSGEVRISTDAAGRVREAVITHSISPMLDANTRSFARANWKGPPNSTRTVPVIYRIP